MRFLCNLHFYEEKRTNYSSISSYSTKMYFSTLRILLLAIRRSTLINNIMIDNEINSIITQFNHYYKLYPIKFSKIKKIDIADTDSLIINKSSCGKQCFLTTNYDDVNITTMNDIDNLSNIWFNKISIEYIFKLAEMHGFDSCSIKLFIKKAIGVDIYCKHIALLLLSKKSIKDIIDFCKLKGNFNRLNSKSYRPIVRGADINKCIINSKYYLILYIRILQALLSFG